MTDPMDFTADPNASTFEKLSHANGDTFWLASELMRLLGYDNTGVFRTAITKAQKVCLSLDIRVEENFIAVVNATGESDTRLSRFACYLVAMNADIGKPEVARAQAYFVAIAESVRRYHEEVDNVARVHLRSEIQHREKSLAGVAKAAEVSQYAFFQNAGYRGMYNMNLADLRNLRSIPSSRSPLDFMGKSELAANLFRITQTEERIKNNNLAGQRDCEVAAEYVGRTVRETMKRAGGTLPEALPKVEDINVVKKGIKQAAKTLKKIDRPKGKK